MRGRYLAELGLFVFFIGLVWSVCLSPRQIQTKSFGGTCSTDAEKKAYSTYINKLYRVLKPDSTGINPVLLRQAVTGYFNLKKDGKVNDPTLCITDTRAKSLKKGLWVINLDKKTLLYKGPDELKKALPPGFYTISTIDDKKGIHLQIEGADKGINDGLPPVMIQSISYSSQKFIETVGHLPENGRSCPIGAPATCHPVKCSTCSKGILYIVPETNSTSELMKEETAITEFVKENPILCMIE